MRLTKAFVRVGTFCAALALAAVSHSANAITVDINQHLTGDNLGNVTVATLDAVQMNGDVQMTLTNTLFAYPTSFETRLYLTYGGDVSGIGFTNVSGVASTGFVAGLPNFGGVDPDLGLGWSSSNSRSGAFRLNPGESSTFKLTNADLDLFFAGSGSPIFTVVHIQGLPNNPEGSSHYSNSTVIPLPASLPLFLAALCGLGLISRRRRVA